MRRSRLVVLQGLILFVLVRAALAAPGLSAEDRAFLDKNFSRFGSAWDGGLKTLERNFIIVASVTASGYRLELTSRDRWKLRFIMLIDKAKGEITGEPSRPPEGNELGPRDRERVDQILGREGRLWFVEPMNGYLVADDVTRGLAAFREAAKPEEPVAAPEPAPGKSQLVHAAPQEGKGSDRRHLEGLRLRATRKVGQTALLYFGEAEDNDEWYGLTVDLSRSAVDRLDWVSLPMDEHRARIVPRKHREALDRALRADETFGESGRCDLDCVMKNADIRFATTRGARAEVTVTRVVRDGRVYFEGPPRSELTLDWSSAKVRPSR